MLQEIAQAIAFVGILVFLAHLFTGIFSRTRIPDVILLIIIGICVGPVLGLASPPLFGAIGPVFTTITLIIILFESGLALKLSMLRSALGGAMVLAPLSFFFTMAVVAGFVIWLTDLELLPAFILGAIVGSTSETVVIPLVRQLRIREDTQTLLSVESSVNDVLSIVITMALVQAYTLGEFEIEQDADYKFDGVASLYPSAGCKINFAAFLVRDSVETKLANIETSVDFKNNQDTQTFSGSGIIWNLKKGDKVILKGKSDTVPVDVTIEFMNLNLVLA